MNPWEPENTNIVDEWIDFPNGYGLSIQRSEHHYSGDNTFEVAVLHERKLCYMAMDDVFSYVSWQELADLIIAIANKPTNNLCNHGRRTP